MIKEWKFVLQFWNDALHLKKLFDFGKTNKSDDRRGLSSPVAWTFFLISSDFFRSGHQNETELGLNVVTVNSAALTNRIDSEIIINNCSSWSFFAFLKVNLIERSISFDASTGE